ncbi:choline dehydrogenase [Enhydrobacter sp.]|jgi:choline dehydrogenase|uniref:GMC family oxidoreductase n=1 Tax=Enhydrobacter sp. TaxID=1894999 RepID=UPI00260B4C99|nr:choline dehydrogenase [Enhydrobacter sp.]WIM13039.1 MAG: Oxidoreductase, GMC family [Enhydrobacter sp.]
MSWPYDYIIIGAGSAGCTIANRLAEDYSLRILILEAGPQDTSFMLRMPAGFASLGENSPYNWRYETVPQKHCDNRRMYWPRGKTLGGSSSINAMLYVRGNGWDYDHWRQLGNAGWSYNDVLPFFKKAENNERGADDFHGAGGPLNVADQADPTPLNEAFLKACEQAGHARVKDFNGASQEGVGYYQVTQKDKQRWSTASAYLRPAVERNKNNVHVVSGALVERIILDQNKAMGVRYSYKGQDEVARCSREIILAGGAVNSPQLLMLSGIGPAAHLEAVGIRPLFDIPGVGGNLQDHVDAAILQFCKTRDTYDTANKLVSLYRYWKHKKGPGTSPIAESGGFLSTREGLSAPDIQLHFLPVLVVDHGRTKMKRNGYSLHVCTLRPESKGTIRLASKDPKQHPLIDANYLAERKDLDTLIEGVKIGREIFAQSGLDPYRADEFQPGASVKSDAEIEQWIRAKCETIYHPVGTCKMGPDNDPAAVVDHQCRVRGIEGLRVVDASVMPTLIGGNTNAPTIMIAERVASYMQGKG